MSKPLDSVPGDIIRPHRHLIGKGAAPAVQSGEGRFYVSFFLRIDRRNRSLLINGIFRIGADLFPLVFQPGRSIHIFRL